MIHAKRSLSYAALLIFLASIASGQSTPQVDANAILRQLVPLPDRVERIIKNPYYAKPEWKLWSVDPSEVVIDKTDFSGHFAPPSTNRCYPVVVITNGQPVIRRVPLTGDASGSWDDCYMSLDNHHSGLNYPKGQMIDGTKMKYETDWQTRFQLGVNFTSQSYAGRGRDIVDDTFNGLYTERYFFFANCIRATPSVGSFSDNNPDGVVDHYDALFSHSFHSVGQSSSEVHALFKMADAGAAMPRPIKDLLKKHGAYAPALLTIFKFALPYTDSQGREVPYSHELRHRPVYSSHGVPQHQHYCAANVHYHGYDEEEHHRRMITLAGEMKVAPPVAILGQMNIDITSSNGVALTPMEVPMRVKCFTPTGTRIWGKPGETIDVTVDLRKCYDLQGLKLSYICENTYPNQKNVSITTVSNGIYKISVVHDPKLPKGRISILCAASNGGAIPSNPVFINIYWPEPNELDDYFWREAVPKEVLAKIDAAKLKRVPSTVNLRPVVDFGVPGDAIACKPGSQVKVKLDSKDPEGFPVAVYRWPGEQGKILDGNLVVDIPKDAKEQIQRLHLIFSDGTGGYTGKELKLLISPRQDHLENGWGKTVIGNVDAATTVSAIKGTITFSGAPFKARPKGTEGTFLFRNMSGDADLVAKVPEGRDGLNLSLMFINTFNNNSRRTWVGYSGGKIMSEVKANENPWQQHWHEQDAITNEAPIYLRITKKDDLLATYASSDRKTWQQMGYMSKEFFPQYFAGILFGGRSNELQGATCEWLASDASCLPVIMVSKEGVSQPGDKTPDIKVEIKAAEGTIHYTIDGADPDETSPVYKEAFALNGLGKHVVKASTFKDGRCLGTVCQDFNLAEKKEK